ncbi:MAG: hypothetical protein M0P94_00670 [Candidatus Absconditabacterales bacterium]|nr:hypothetical protein [Candidatus Absconditabacterales bacterium]
MDNNFKKEFEKYLNNHEKQHYIKNWKKLSERFGKDLLLTLFENGKEYLKKTYSSGDKERFLISFKGGVHYPLLEKANLSFVKKNTYNSLMSLYSIYLNVSKQYEKKEEQIRDEIWKETQEEKMRNKNKTSEETPEVIKTPGMRDIRGYEKDIFSISPDGDIGLPGELPKEIEENNILDFNANLEKENNKGYKVIEEENGQLKIDFD